MCPNNSTRFSTLFDRPTPLAWLRHIRLSCLVFFLLPFILFWWLTPFLSRTTIGQDYGVFSINAQQELLFSLHSGSIPLFVPGLAGGQSAVTLSLGQFFHPIAHLAALLPGYWQGQALEWNTLLRLLSLGLAHLLAFRFFCRIGTDIGVAFAASALTVYNLRMLDLFRYGASVESYTGFLFLSIAIGFYWLKPHGWRGPAAIIVSTYWLVCSGHPQMAYYGLIGAALFALAVPFYIPALSDTPRVDTRAARQFWRRCGLFGLAGICLSAAFIFPFYFDFMATNYGRVGRDYQWTTSLTDTVWGTISNFFLPLRSDVHSAFGGSVLFLVAALVPLLRALKVKIPGVIWMIWSAAFVILLYMQGECTPVHQWSWRVLPFASAMRVPGRAALLLPFLFSLLLVWLSRVRPCPLSFRGRTRSVSASVVLCGAGILGALLYTGVILLTKPPVTRYAPAAIRDISTGVELAFVLVGLITLGLWALRSGWFGQSRSMGIALNAAVCTQLLLSLQYGTWLEQKRDTPTYAEMAREKGLDLSYRFVLGSGLYSSVVLTQATQSFLEPFLSQIYHREVWVTTQTEAYATMSKSRSPEQIFIESASPPGGKTEPLNERVDPPSTVDLSNSSFNRLVFRVLSPKDAYFGLAYPYTAHWLAFVNDQRTTVYRANGAAHAVRIPAGASTVEFRYWSHAAVWGALISAITFAASGIALALSMHGKWPRLALAGAFVVVGAMGFGLGYHSLYAGKNLRTDYHWSYTRQFPPNLAYGKNAQMSSSPVTSEFHLYCGSRAVDGDRRPGGGFRTGNQDNPAILIDLKSEVFLKTIVLYESAVGARQNTRPLSIAVSLDRQQWSIIAQVSNSVQKAPMRLELERPQPARYLALSASGHCFLSMDEIELYGPSAGEGSD